MREVKLVVIGLENNYKGIYYKDQYRAEALAGEGQWENGTMGKVRFFLKK